MNLIGVTAISQIAKIDKIIQAGISVGVSGEFIVPTGGGLVHQIVNNLNIASYCLMFEDNSLPIYDAVLMKILLLKNDPERFIKTSNRFATLGARACNQRRG